MTPTQTAILSVVLGAAMLFLMVLVFRARGQRRKLFALVEREGWKLHPYDDRGLGKTIAGTAFAIFANKPRLYDVLDTGLGVLAHAAVGVRNTHIYRVFIDEITAPDLLLMPKSDSGGLAVDALAELGFRHVDGHALDRTHYVLGRNTATVSQFLAARGADLERVIGTFGVEVAGGTLLCYRPDDRAPLDQLVPYVEECQAITAALGPH